jgi:hypothetical protein
MAHLEQQRCTSARARQVLSLLKAGNEGILEYIERNSRADSSGSESPVTRARTPGSRASRSGTSLGFSDPVRGIATCTDPAPALCNSRCPPLHHTFVQSDCLGLRMPSRVLTGQPTRGPTTTESDQRRRDLRPRLVDSSPFSSCRSVTTLHASSIGSVAFARAARRCSMCSPKLKTDGSPPPGPTAHAAPASVLWAGGFVPAPSGQRARAVTARRAIAPHLPRHRCVDRFSRAAISVNVGPFARPREMSSRSASDRHPSAAASASSSSASLSDSSSACTSNGV